MIRTLISFGWRLPAVDLEELPGLLLQLQASSGKILTIFVVVKSLPFIKIEN